MSVATASALVAMELTEANLDWLQAAAKTGNYPKRRRAPRGSFCGDECSGARLPKHQVAGTSANAVGNLQEKRRPAENAIEEDARRLRQRQDVEVAQERSSEPAVLT